MKELALHILDIAENSIRAGADKIRIFVTTVNDILRIGICDNGRGMTEDELKQLGDPFFTSRTRRRVGMGIPLLRQHAEMAGGGIDIHSEAGQGTSLEAFFMEGHPDRQPLGDLEGCWMMLVASNPGIEWELSLDSKEGCFEISSSEIRSALEVETIRGGELLGYLKRMIRNNIDELILLC